VKAARNNANLEGRLFAVVFWWTLVVGTLDCGVLLGVLKVRPLYLTFIAGPVLLGVGLVLLRRFVTAADTVERARGELEVRIAEKTLALECNLVRLKDMEREWALSTERERIMRDVHDGVGGQLVQALSIVANRPELRPLEDPLRTCLDELRLIIDSMEPAEGDLASVLGTLRTRMSRRLIAAGVHIHWQVEELPVLTEFGPQKVLQVTRIVQEAIVNALQQHQAKNITVRAQPGPQYSVAGLEPKIVIEIVADGHALRAADDGNAVSNNMRRRAEEMGWQFTMHYSPQDVSVCLELPLTVAYIKESDVSQSPRPALRFTRQTA
jgi:signal transduction histidine kinase